MSLRPCLLVLPLFAASLAQAQTLSASLTADNVFTASISTDPTQAGTVIATGANWQVTFNGQYTFPAAGRYYLQIAAVDQGPPAMFIGNFSLDNANARFANGTQSLLSNGADWVVSSTGFGQSTVSPQVIGQNGISPWGTVAGVGTDAAFVWMPGTNGGSAFFTAIVDVVPTPGVAIVPLAGVLAISRRRR